MSKKLLIATTIALSVASFPCISNAADDPSSTTASAPVSTPASASTEMTKDSWLSSMSPLLPELICKGFVQDTDLKKRFDEIKMTYEQCVTLIPDSATKCQNQIYKQIPDKITSDSAAIWGKNLGECIGKDFAEKYLVPKS